MVVVVQSLSTGSPRFRGGGEPEFMISIGYQDM